MPSSRAALVRYLVVTLSMGAWSCQKAPEHLVLAGVLPIGQATGRVTIADSTFAMTDFIDIGMHQGYSVSGSLSTQMVVQPFEHTYRMKLVVPFGDGTVYRFVGHVMPGDVFGPDGPLINGGSKAERDGVARQLQGYHFICPDTTGHNALSFRVSRRGLEYLYGRGHVVLPSGKNVTLSAPPQSTDH